MREKVSQAFVAMAFAPKPKPQTKSFWLDLPAENFTAICAQRFATTETTTPKQRRRVEAIAAEQQMQNS